MRDTKSRLRGPEADADVNTDLHDTDPETIDITFVPRPKPAVVSTPVGSEMVVVDSDSGMVHALNPVAALVWQCFDGESSLGEIVADLAEAFQTPTQVVRNDVIGMVRTVGRAGLLEGVREDQAPSSGPPTGLPVGDRILVFGRPGRVQTRRILLINWSAHCGFCIRILPALASLQPDLDRVGVEIVLVDDSTASETEGLCLESGLAASVVSGAEREVDSTAAFQGFGTPVAYLIDQAGRIASQLAYGADAVLELAGSEAGINVAGRKAAVASGSSTVLPEAGAVCGPASRAASPSRFEAARAYEVGPYQVGIRANSPWAEGIVASALSRLRLPDSVTAPDNFSIVLSEDGDKARRDLNILQAGSVTVARSRSPRRVMMALAGHLSCLLEPEPGLSRLDAMAGVVDGRALLLPKRLLSSHLESLQAPLAKMGVRLVHEPFAHIDFPAADLVVVAPRVPLDDGILKGLPDPVPGISEPAPVLPGRYPLKAWFMPSEHQLSPASAVSMAASTLVADAAEVPASIDLFAALLQRADAIPVHPDDPHSLKDSLRKWITAKEDS